MIDREGLCGRFEKNGFIPYLESIRYLILSHDTGDWELKKSASGGHVRGKSAVQSNRMKNMQMYKTVTHDEDAQSMTTSVFDYVANR